MKPVTTEKAIMMIEAQNILTFETEMIKKKEDIKKELEEVLGVKIEKIRTSVRKNKKYVYAKLNKEYPAIDVATKLGLM